MHSADNNIKMPIFYYTTLYILSGILILCICNCVVYIHSPTVKKLNSSLTACCRSFCDVPV